MSDSSKKKTNEDVLATYFKEINQIPLLSKSEEKSLARRAVSGDLLAREKLIQANLRFVVKVAKKFRSRGLPFEDLISEGNIGLMTAVKHFDPEKGYHFISYAVWWIRQAILKAIGEKSRMIRLPLHKVQELLQIAKVRQDLRDERYHSRSEVEMIAQRLHCDCGSVVELLDISRELLSLETPSCSENEFSPLGDFVEDGGGSQPEELLLKGSLRDDIKGILNSLPQRESEILQCRFGLNDEAPMTLGALGSRYKLSKERIRQIEQKALDRLKLPSRSRLLEAYADRKGPLPSGGIIKESWGVSVRRNHEESARKVDTRKNPQS